jgi:preprotein translocase subunit YajC
MNLNTLTAILGQVPATSGPQQNPTGGAVMMIGYVVILVAMFYFVAIRPQQKRAKDLNTLLKSLRPGDKVVTASGIIGTVVSVKDKSVALRSAETKLEVLKSTISEITERSGGESTSTES